MVYQKIEMNFMEIIIIIPASLQVIIKYVVDNIKEKIKGIIILNRTATMTLMTYDGNTILKRYI